SEEDLKNAIKNLRNALKFNPTNPFIYSNLALILCDSIILCGEPYFFEEVLSLFEKATHLKTDYIIYSNWGMVLTHIGDITKNTMYLKDSISKFNKVLKLNPFFTEIYYNWAYCLEILSKINND
ncbi:tetratricopeptide repeat protein, partial [Burkholderia sp. SIMBA_043]